MNNNEEEELCLKDIRTKLKEIEEARMKDSYSKEEIDALEISSCALKDAERILILKKENTLSDNINTIGEELLTFNKELRARVKRMNHVPKILDGIEEVLGICVRIIKGFKKW
ncbi:MAG: hypothetical protein WC140_04650 [Bacteroidales bacterium]